MRISDQSRPPRAVPAVRRSPRLTAAFGGLALSAALSIVGTTASATAYNEGTQGDLSNSPTAPTNIGTLTNGNNYIVGSSVPSGAAIPGGHGALANQDNDFFTFTVPTGDALTHFDLLGNTSIVAGDRFFLGIYSGATAPVDPSNPTPAGLLGYTLPGVPQIGTDVLPALAASNEPGFPTLASNFSGSLPAGQYTVWIVDGDQPLHYGVDLQVAAVPEPATWALMLVGLAGAMLRRRGSTKVGAIFA